MYDIVLRVNAPPGSEQAIKEDLAMYLERYGDVRIISIQNIGPRQEPMEQLDLKGFRGPGSNTGYDRRKR